MSDPEELRFALRRVGLTEAEVEALVAFDTAVDLIRDLPVQHPRERSEAVAAIHRLQDLLLARPAMRALGWPKRAPDSANPRSSDSEGDATTRKESA